MYTYRDIVYNTKTEYVLAQVEYILKVIQLQRILLLCVTFLIVTIEVGIGFDQSSYLASESDGVVVVCIRVSQGGLQRTVQVTVNTEDGTATGLF